MKTIQQITWKTGEPDHFPCLICNENQAKYLIITDLFRFPLCGDCALLSEEELTQKIKTVSIILG